MLDLRALKCPMPALLARKALERLKPSQQIEVWADDPMAVIDIPHMCHQQGFDCVSVQKMEAYTQFILARPQDGTAPDEMF